MYGAFVWARRALNRPFRRFPARAVLATKDNEELADGFKASLSKAGIKPGGWLEMLQSLDGVEYAQFVAGVKEHMGLGFQGRMKDPTKKVCAAGCFLSPSPAIFDDSNDITAPVASLSIQPRGRRAIDSACRAATRTHPSRVRPAARLAPGRVCH